MPENEIIKYIKDEIENETDTYHWFDNLPENETRKQIEESIKAHQGLLDLYNKEKEKNKKLEEYFLKYNADIEKEFQGLINHKFKDYISKDKIRELLEKYDKSIAWANADDHYYFTKFIKDLLEENNV